MTDEEVCLQAYVAYLSGRRYVYDEHPSGTPTSTLAARAADDALAEFRTRYPKK